MQRQTDPKLASASRTLNRLFLGSVLCLIGLLGCSRPLGVFWDGQESLPADAEPPPELPSLAMLWTQEAEGPTPSATGPVAGAPTGKSGDGMPLRAVSQVSGLAPDDLPAGPFVVRTSQELGSLIAHLGLDGEWKVDFRDNVVVGVVDAKGGGPGRWGIERVVRRRNAAVVRLRPRPAPSGEGPNARSLLMVEVPAAGCKIVFEPHAARTP